MLRVAGTPPNVHPTAVVNGRLSQGVVVGPYAVIEEDTTVGERTEVRAHAIVKRYTSLGPGNTVHEGAVLGGEPQDLGYVEAPTRLEIGADNRIREGVTLHRASRAGAATVVGSGCFLMAQAHVAHDCRLGDRVILANKVILAGHVDVGDGAFLSGFVGIHQFCRVGRLAMVGGHSKIVQDCLPFVITDGSPGRSRGLNVVGLRRAGIGTGPMRALKEAYRLLLRSSLPLAEALQQIDRIEDTLARELADFVRASKRGFCRAGREPMED